jgi:hypothetical protein
MIIATLIINQEGNYFSALICYYIIMNLEMST